MKKLIFLLVVLAAGGGAWALRHKKGDGRERALRWTEAAQGPIEDTVEATGSVVARNRVEVRPPIGGRIEELLVDEGTVVKAGQVIAWMSSNDRAAIMDAARAQGESELKRWQDAYKPTPIIAPLSGAIILRNVVVGQTVEPSTVLYAMADTLIVLAQVDESDIGRVRVGMPARIILDAYPDRPISGAVYDVLYEGKNVQNVITYGVKVRPVYVPGFFRSQMTANVGFIAGRKVNAILVPVSAVQGQTGARQVLVQGPDGKPLSRPVTTGLEIGDKVEVLSGLAAGEKILLARGRYVPQQGPQSSPLGFGGRGPGGPTGEAPRQRRRPGGGGGER